MQFDIVWFLLALPLAFVLGWLASRYDFRQLRLQNRRHPKAYFRALKHWLLGDGAQALLAFEEAVRNDPDTPELQFALGHLYRERGFYAPAVRMHEHLTMRGDLPAEDRQRAQYELAMDFTRAGILDRAEQVLTRLEGSPHESQSRQIRLAIAERLRDWPQAEALATALQPVDAPLYSSRLAHYLCERAKDADDKLAIRLLQQAHQAAPNAPRPLLDLARRCLALGQGHAAAELAVKIHQQHGIYLGLVAMAYTKAWLESAPMLQTHLQWPELLLAAYQQEPSQDLLQALLQLQHAGEVSASEDALYAHYWAQRPSIFLANRWLWQAAQAAQLQVPQALGQAIEKAEKPFMRYRCQHCGFEAERYYWHCPGCQAWDSYPPVRVDEQN